MEATHEDARQAALDKFDLTLTLKEKQREALDHILDHCFDKICDVIVYLPIGYGKSLVYYPMYWERLEEGPRHRMCGGDMSSQLDPIRPAQKSHSTWCTSLQSIPRLSS